MNDLTILIEQKAEEYTPRVLHILGHEEYRRTCIDAFKEEITSVMETRHVTSIDDLSSEHRRSIKLLGHGTAMRRTSATRNCAPFRSSWNREQFGIAKSLALVTLCIGEIAGTQAGRLCALSIATTGR